MSDKTNSSLYRYVYDKEWEKSYPIKRVKDDKHAFYCVPCDHEYSCAYNGIRNVSHHCNTWVHRQKETEHISAKTFTESVSDDSSSSPRTSISESIPKDLNFTSPSTPINQPSLSGAEGIPNSTSSENSSMVSKSYNLRKKELKSESNISRDELKARKILEKFKKAYRLGPNSEIDKDLECALRRNADMVFECVNEELLFLESVLAELQHYKK
ncbi:hypothetical protein RF11_10982 [Thelohanellus kitauei]|uniref:Uncharacterized protein n=1 Tax=Thelohanellus kitauei TaxID=669202 RepID=A0A0C2M9Q2_THEKT|nr:hypothetical protein RF11_10982 [Thelohanellus kitauei]